MPVAYFDMIGGAAGDMIVGALLDAGLSLDQLRADLARLGVAGFSVTADRVLKQQIAARQFLVHVAGGDDHHHASGGESAHGRSLREIEALISASDLDDAIKEGALRTFQTLGEAEARVHGVAISEVHFHEVGAIDSIVDIVGAAIGFYRLGITRVYSSPFPVGSGTIQTRHGLYPIPAPATLEILAASGAPTRPSRIAREQVTPTGAAILSSLAEFRQPAMRIRSVGYGSGQADLEIPNVLRVWIGDEDGQGEHLVMVETNIDDMNPELYPHVMQQCADAGALDVSIVPCLMKKGRPGNKIEVLCPPDRLEAVRAVLFTETTTLGVRSHPVDRVALERRIIEVETEYGIIAVKVKYRDGRPVATAPEFDACRRIASERAVPVRAVYAAATRAGETAMGL